MLPVILRHAADDPRPCGGTAIQARHRQIDPGFIEEFQALDVARCDLLPGGRARLLDPRGVPCGGMVRLFCEAAPAM
jgi:hypothetical protein